ncbi:MAG: hypothetical protein E7231_16825 [Cellulosilyticum sp.]|nr:hypothetical protein [Cellulosilyticum sp.]
MNYQKLNPKAKGCMYVAEGIMSILGIIIILGLNQWLWLPKGIKFASIVSYGVIVVLLLNALIGPPLRYNRYGYAISEDCIDIKEGYFFVNRYIVPIERLHKLKMESGPIDHLFGLTKLTVTTAGGDVTIRFLEEKVAQQIADWLKYRINTIALDEKRKAQEFHKEVNYETKEI